MDDSTKYSRIIIEEALRLGFDDAGISPADVNKKDTDILENWLDNKFHAEMEWMNRNQDLRRDPTLLVPNAKSVITVLLNYYTSTRQSDPQAPVVSKYAFGRDYHKVLKKKLKELLSFIQKQIPEAKGRAFVDSAPILEHSFARNAGLGWIGKNSLFISPRIGSFVFIGEIILDQKLKYTDKHITDLCGNCTLCVTHCPTSAIQPGRIVDANKCLSYHTIENKNNLPDSLKENFFNRVFGCDICQEVCPWNRKAKNSKTEDFTPKNEFLQLSREEWENMDEETFTRLFTGTPVMRTKYKGLKRNIDFLKNKDSY